MTNRQTDRQNYRRQTEGYTYIQAGREIDRPTGKQKVGQTDRMTDRQTYRQREKDRQETE
jgi:hypothetical protein